MGYRLIDGFLDEISLPEHIEILQLYSSRV